MLVQKKKCLNSNWAPLSICFDSRNELFIFGALFGRLSKDLAGLLGVELTGCRWAGPGHRAVGLQAGVGGGGKGCSHPLQWLRDGGHPDPDEPESIAKLMNPHVTTEPSLSHISVCLAQVR